ncbi:MAG: hypothetical protein A3G82_08830 [Burkholderiales bacterium RIFCSPLOWO2_12_FULL_67_210]|nr:MAG: hypothetical protein A3G82_08830 [Burkholderiales bacterium RIFCSPLOWO2_12_FULL_67_210]
MHVRETLALTRHHLGVHLHHREPPAGLGHALHQRRKEADHAQVVLRTQLHVAERIARGRWLVAHPAPDRVGQGVDGGQRDGALHRAATGQALRKGQRVRALQGHVAAAVRAQQRGQRVAEQHIGQAKSTVFQLDGAELGIVLTGGTHGIGSTRHVQTAHPWRGMPLRDGRELREDGRGDGGCRVHGGWRTAGRWCGLHRGPAVTRFWHSAGAGA